MPDKKKKRQKNRQGQRKQRQPHECVCDACGMTFYVKQFDKTDETMKNGNAVKVLSFTCPKCDNRYIVSVMNAVSKELRAEFDEAKAEYEKQLGKDGEHEAWQVLDSKKRMLFGYMSRLKKQYLKEVKRREYSK